MPYRIQIHSSIEANVRRIACEQIDKALLCLNTGVEDEAVHGARKCFKRIRALLRLARPALKGGVYFRENAAIRGIAQSLSETRDFDVLPQTLAMLQARDDAPDDVAIIAVRRALHEARLRAEIHDRAETIDAAVAALEQARERLAGLVLKDATIEPLTAGMARNLKRLRKDYRQALRSGGSEEWHQLRKRVQIHWRNLKILAPAWPGVLEARRETAQQLAGLLGADHDLAVLDQFVSGSDLSEQHMVAMERACGRVQTALRDEARNLAEALFEVDEKEFAKQIAKRWHALAGAAGAD